MPPSLPSTENVGFRTFVPTGRMSDLGRIRNVRFRTEGQRLLAAAHDPSETFAASALWRYS